MIRLRLHRALSKIYIVLTWTWAGGVPTGFAISLGLEEEKRLKELKAQELTGPVSGTTGRIVDWLQRGLCFEATPVEFMQAGRQPCNRGQKVASEVLLCFRNRRNPKPYLSLAGTMCAAGAQPESP